MDQDEQCGANTTLSTVYSAECWHAKLSIVLLFYTMVGYCSDYAFVHIGMIKRLILVPKGYMYKN